MWTQGYNMALFKYETKIRSAVRYVLIIPWLPCHHLHESLMQFYVGLRVQYQVVCPVCDILCRPSGYVPN